MKLSLKGLVAILSSEAIYLYTYNDGAGYATIGAGHTKMAGKPYPKYGMTITLKEALEIFQRDMIKYEKAVNDAIKVPLSQNEFDALVSWHFNTGGVTNSTLTRLLNKGHKSEVPVQLKRWNKVRGKVWKGLTKRRQHEIDIWSDGNYGDGRIVLKKTKGGKATTIGLADVMHVLGDTSLPEVIETATPVPVDAPAAPEAPKSALRVLVELLFDLLFMILRK